MRQLLVLSVGPSAATPSNPAMEKNLYETVSSKGILTALAAVGTRSFATVHPYPIL